ncbi:TraR/DksA C4-type zinc finger protein [Nocardiopsis sp. N85]|uniref:TraR/DksA family transcriptional regulator n=1 Tax=Nocardiopsis sp. N85 TaxID=3029400 RepID=UPI00237F89A5|nr:TraR/DksA C4-type zinc finger protein [Nocardiopsis sp. N85]MDE3720271.1 TraR/DksA C4-type zinc finger protein [Nocardiopsis sp. N85]
MKATEAADMPVLPGEDPWTSEELVRVRDRLENDIATAREEIRQVERQVAERLTDPVEGAGDDPADTGAKAFEREHELALAYNTRDLLAASERAIERMHAGTYGICESCGRPTGKARLQAFPRATLCVTCKQREERR